MQTTERHLEAAEAFDAGERDRTVARIRQSLDEAGEVDCVDCGEPIDIARRMALPSARRCITCQEARERQ